MKTSLVAAGLCLWSVAASSAALADELPGTGTIAGTVVSKQPFRAAKVYARDAARGVTYMVYTSQGKYRAVNVLPGAYEVIVQHPGLAAAAQRVAVESGKTAAADFALSAATAAATPPSKTVVAPYEEIYLQGAARHTIERTCIKCHGVNWLPERPQSEASWTAMVDLMLDMKDTGPWGVSNGTPLIPPGEISPEQRRELIAYLARNFGADKPA
ncbi:MAG TPA: carboxypeptidase-like regulatory domain-containing protein, partial [Steroidobacteraceae bacterium]|nr:carboxypeptidase-like regulatory domain-containing protein [Steroidobacteraceae bacterium]